jgi:hypothetical protein
MSGFVEDRLLWSVKAEERFKTLTGFGGDPVGILALRRFGAGVDVDCAVGIGLEALNK